MNKASCKGDQNYTSATAVIWQMFTDAAYL